MLPCHQDSGPVRLGWDFSLPKLWANNFLLVQMSRFKALCYRNKRKLRHPCYGLDTVRPLLVLMLAAWLPGCQG